jgi:hypothetical protein
LLSSWGRMQLCSSHSSTSRRLGWEKEFFRGVDLGIFSPFFPETPPSQAQRERHQENYVIVEMGKRPCWEGRLTFPLWGHFLAWQTCSAPWAGLSREKRSDRWRYCWPAAWGPLSAEKSHKRSELEQSSSTSQGG